jgi:hypothetical protein
MASSSSLPNYLSFENQRTRCLDIGFNPDEGLLQDPQKHRSNDVKQGVSVPFFIYLFTHFSHENFCYYFRILWVSPYFSVGQ